jgi:hypothetical protein
MSTGRTTTFKSVERTRQVLYFDREFPGQAGHQGRAFELLPEHARLSLAPALRSDAVMLFAAEPAIQWHRFAGHGLSSQTCCLNFLLPFADKPDLLGRWIGAGLGIAPPEMLVIEPGRAGRDWYVAFEWIGEHDYLNESGPDGGRRRGANATASDAAVKFRDADGKTHLLLIEWKYTESYGAPLTGDLTGKRPKRYGAIAFAPNGPIRADAGLTLADFFWEPFYQLLRQQMLAHRIQADPESGVDRARVLHLSPAGNRALHRVTAPALARFGSDAFEVFRSLLVDPDAFIGRTIEAAFAPLAEWPEADWLSYLRDRYPGLCAPFSKDSA